METITTFRKISAHITVKLEIKNFFELSYSPGVYIESPIFLLSDAEWRIRIYPNGELFSPGWISVFLKKNITANKHRVLYSFAIKFGTSVYKKRDYEITFAECDSRGFNEFARRTDLKDYMKTSPCDGTVTVVCSIRLLELSGSELEPLDSVETLTKVVKNLYLSNEKSDLEMIVGKRHFKAHRGILAAWSPVFTSMFNNNPTEVIRKAIEIPDFDPDDFEDFLIFLYTGTFDHVTSFKATRLYEIAVKFQVHELKQKCVLKMSTDLTLDAVLDILRLAFMHNETILLRTATDFFVKNKQRLRYTEKWLKFLEEENPSLTTELILEMMD